MATITYHPDTTTEMETAAPQANTNETQPTNASQSEMKFEKSASGVSLEKIIGRLDLVGVIATIIYYARAVGNLGDAILLNGSFDYFHALNTLAANTGILGIALLTFSLFTFVAIFYFTIKKKMRREIGSGKFIWLLIWNGIWIVGDAYLLFLVLTLR